MRRGLTLVALLVVGCGGVAATPGPPEFPLVACRLDLPGSPTPPPGYEMVAPGRIAFTQDAWQNMTGSGRECGAQAVRGAATRFDLSSLGGEDGILWAATLARPGQPVAADPVPPTMTLVRTDQNGSVPVATQVGELTEQYRMMGNYGHDARPGSYVMRIVSGTGTLLAEGQFEVVP